MKLCFCVDWIQNAAHSPPHLDKMNYCPQCSGATASHAASSPAPGHCHRVTPVQGSNKYKIVCRKINYKQGGAQQWRMKWRHPAPALLETLFSPLLTSSPLEFLFIVSVKIGRKMREHLINYECVLPLQSYHPPHTKYFSTSNHNNKENLWFMPF